MSPLCRRSQCGVERRKAVPVSGPVPIGASRQQQLGGATLTAVTRGPEPRVAVPLRDGAGTESRCERIGKPQRCLLPAAGCRAPFEQAHGSDPLPEHGRVKQRRSRPVTDGAARGVDVRAQVEQRVHRGDVAAAGRPMQRRLSVRAVEGGVHVRTGIHEDVDRRSDVRRVSGSVGGDVQEGASSIDTTEASHGKVRLLP